MTYDVQIDDTDADIINLLREEGRLQNTDVARRLGISEATARKRINRLVKEKIVQFNAIADHKKIGYSNYIHLDIKCIPSYTNNIAESLCKYDEIAFVGICLGQADIRVTVFGKSMEDIYNTVERIKENKNINSITMNQVVKVLKRDFSFLVDTGK